MSELDGSRGTDEREAVVGVIASLSLSYCQHGACAPLEQGRLVPFLKGKRVVLTSIQRVTLRYTGASFAMLMLQQSITIATSPIIN